MPRYHRFLAALATGVALVLSLWLAAIPGQAEEQAEDSRRPVTCTDSAGVIYERGTPGFERCLSETHQEGAEQEMAGKVTDAPETPSPTPTSTANGTRPLRKKTPHKKTE